MPSSNHRATGRGGRAPFAASVLLGTAAVLLSPCVTSASDYASETRAYNLAHGRVVFEQHCMECHASGQREAPVFGDVADWSQRLEQPLDLLIRHAIDGHGRMPPKGDLTLSDQQVAAAVAFVVDRTRGLMPTVHDLDRLPPTASGGDRGATVTDDNDLASGNAAVLQMFMLLYGKERWR